MGSLCNYDNCSYKTNNSSNLKRHLLSHTNSIKHRFFCTLCVKSFRDKYNLIKHKQSLKHCQAFTQLLKDTLPALTADNINNYSNIKIEHRIKNRNAIFKEQETVINKRIKGKGISLKKIKEQITDNHDQEQIKEVKKYNVDELNDIKNNVMDYDISIVASLLANVSCPYQLSYPAPMP